MIPDKVDLSEVRLRGHLRNRNLLVNHDICSFMYDIKVPLTPTHEESMKERHKDSIKRYNNLHHDTSIYSFI